MDLRPSRHQQLWLKFQVWCLVDARQYYIIWFYSPDLFCRLCSTLKMGHPDNTHAYSSYICCCSHIHEYCRSLMRAQSSRECFCAAFRLDLVTLFCWCIASRITHSCPEQAMETQMRSSTWTVLTSQSKFLNLCWCFSTLCLKIVESNHQWHGLFALHVDFERTVGFKASMDT